MRTYSCMRVLATKSHSIRTLCNVCECICYILFHLLMLLVFSNLLHLLRNYTWEMKKVETYGISMIAKFREKDRHGHFRSNKVFRQMKKPHTNYNYNTCALVSRTGSDNTSELIITSNQVSPPTTTVFLDRFPLGHKCGSAQVLNETTGVAYHSYQVNKIFMICTC